jgi:hypothetical protein
VRFYAEKALVKRDEKKKRLERENRRNKSAMETDADRLSIVVEIKDDDVNSHSIDDTSDDSTDEPDQDEILAVGHSFLAVKEPKKAPQPIASTSSNSASISSAFPNAVNSVLERRHRSGSITDFEKSLVTSLSSTSPTSSATFKKAASLFLKRGIVASPVPETPFPTGSRHRRGRAGSLVGTETHNLTKVNLCVVDWTYTTGPVKLPRDGEARVVHSGTMEGLGGEGYSDDDDLSIDERGEKHGWVGGDKLNLTIAIKNEKQFRRLLKLLAEFEE